MAKDTTIPKLTYQQRRSNLDKANKVRRERMRIRKDLACGYLNAEEVILRSIEGDRICSGMRVKQLINALPGYGLKQTQLVMETVGIADNRRIGGLGDRQIELLLNIL